MKDFELRISTKDTDEIPVPSQKNPPSENTLYIKSKQPENSVNTFEAVFDTYNGERINLTPIATASTNGWARPGDHLTVTDDGKLNVKVANSNTKGVVQIGDNLTLSNDGTVQLQHENVHSALLTSQSFSWQENTLSLQPATSNTLGGVKINDSFNVVLNADGELKPQTDDCFVSTTNNCKNLKTLGYATKDTPGCVVVGENISITKNNIGYDDNTTIISVKHQDVINAINPSTSFDTTTNENEFALKIAGIITSTNKNPPIGGIKVAETTNTTVGDGSASYPFGLLRPSKGKAFVGTDLNDLQQLKYASSETHGCVQIGDNITENQGNISVTSDNVCDALGFNTGNDSGQTSISNRFLNNMFRLMYPLGQIYMTVSFEISSSTDRTLTINNVSTVCKLWRGCYWVPWGQGRVPVGVTNTNGYDDGSGKGNWSTGYFEVPDKSGGEYRHTLTKDEIPSHTHDVPNHNHSVSTPINSNGVWSFNTVSSNGNLAKYVAFVENTDGTLTYNYTTTNNTYIIQGGACTTKAAGGQSALHNNIQPYITCYMWKRVK